MFKQEYVYQYLSNKIEELSVELETAEIYHDDEGVSYYKRKTAKYNRWLMRCSKLKKDDLINDFVDDLCSGLNINLVDFVYEYVMFLNPEVERMRTAIRKRYKEKEWKECDAAHQEDHFAEVFKTAIYINKMQALNYPIKMLLFAAYYHDLFSTVQWRDKHHEMAYNFIANGECEILTSHLTEMERQHVAQAALEHRASFKGEYTTEFAELFASADRGLPSSVDRLLVRAIKYRKDHDVTDGDHRTSAIEHVKEKYGTGGYARYPELYLKTFSKELEQLRKEVDGL